MSETAKIDFNPQRKMFMDLGEAMGMKTDWEICAKIKLGKNGVNEIFTDFLELASLEFEDVNTTAFRSDLRKKVEIEVPKYFAAKYNRQTATRIGNQAFQRCLTAVMYWFYRNLEQYGQDGAIRLLKERMKSLNSTNGPRIYFKEDMKEDEVGEQKP